MEVHHSLRTQLDISQVKYLKVVMLSAGSSNTHCYPHCQEWPSQMQQCNSNAEKLGLSFTYNKFPSTPVSGEDRVSLYHKTL